MRKNSLLLIFLLGSWLARAQYGFEWINFDQSYYKIKLNENGWYRVTRAELEAQGFPVASVNADRLQMFRRGQELAIQVAKQGDNTLDYVEFYGERNDARYDTELYEQPEFHAHEKYSLFTDSAAYFITWREDAGPTRRISSASPASPAGLTPLPHHQQETFGLTVGNFNEGTPAGQAGGEFLYSSRYSNGEAFGRRRRTGQTETLTFTLEDVAGMGQPMLTFTLLSYSSGAHSVDVEAGPNTGSLRTLTNVQFEGYGFVKETVPFELTDIDASGQLVIRYRVVASSAVGPSETIVHYPQTLNQPTGEQRHFYIPDQSPTDRALLSIGTMDATGVRLYDVTDPFNPILLPKTDFADRLEVVVPNSDQDRLVLAVSNPLAAGTISAANISTINPVGKDYLIITHSGLREPVNGTDPVQRFINYRESPAGGSHSILTAEIRNLYNLFNYGDPSGPQAIRKYLEYVYAVGTPERLFIIGKGQEYRWKFYYIFSTDSVHVPTFGAPGGDNLFVEGLANPDELALEVGRLSVTSPVEVDNYVSKVIAMESLPFDALWRKDVLQLSGGQTSSELATFAGYIEDFEGDVVSDFLGGRAINFKKQSTQVVEYIDITEVINEGAGLVTFFGHSSGTIADIEIGFVTDGQFGYNNRDKYPVFLINGCDAGGIFRRDTTFGENWMKARQLGALAFIAHTEQAANTNLKLFSDLFYEFSFNDSLTLGKSIGSILLQTAKAFYERFGNSPVSQTQVLQTQLQGDPAITIFGAREPDYAVTPAEIQVRPLQGNQLLASQDSIDLWLPVKNFGRTVLDSLVIQVDRTFPGGQTTSYFKGFPRVLRLDTLQFRLPNPVGTEISGINRFQIFIDPVGDTPELNKTNNQATVEATIFEGTILNLLPPAYFLTTKTNLPFFWQPADVFISDRSYSFELDTVPTFNSTYLLQRTLSGYPIITTEWSHVFTDTTTVYWRTRFANPQNEEEEFWTESSLTFVPGGSLDEGYGQFSRAQVESNQLSGVDFNNGKDWAFITSNTEIALATTGADATPPNHTITINGIDYLLTSLTLGNNRYCDEDDVVNVIFFDRESTQPYRPYAPSSFEQPDYQIPQLCGRLPQVVYHLTMADLTGAESYLTNGIENMQNGDFIAIISFGDMSYSNWVADAGLASALESVGISTATISALTDGQPFVALGTKGMLPGEATLRTEDGSGNPPREQALSLEDSVSGTFTAGRLTTRPIGPARTWGEFEYQIREESNDQFDIAVIGITPSGEETNLFNFARGDIQDLSGVDALTYPFIKLDFSFQDVIDVTPPQFDFWRIQYELPPDGILFPADTAAISIYEGAPVAVPYLFYNYTDVSFTDSLEVTASLRNQNTGNLKNQTFSITPILARDSLAFETAIPSRNLPETNNLAVQLTAKENELYAFNNADLRVGAVEIQEDNTNPVLDITFDGKYILDGDIVSPNPAIRIRIKDDNPFINKTDTLGLQLDLKGPCQGCAFERVPLNQPNISTIDGTADQDFELSFTPQLLEDGIYTLRVQGRDAQNNVAGLAPYEINFEVINESTITHFYPYPNPFSTSTRFVFTLTGAKVPDRLKIQIMTISGRIVREISKAELGPITIGNNISTFAWDGTDEYGDALANGVYFYRVLMEDDEERFKRRKTAGDRAFKNNFGKLYILR